MRDGNEAEGGTIINAELLYYATACMLGREFLAVDTSKGWKALEEGKHGALEQELHPKATPQLCSY